MSARPRPVTATFLPRSLAPPTGVRTRSYSLSSGASTESLTSVLDHDSYVSLGDDSEPETTQPTTTTTEQRQQNGRHGNNSTPSKPQDTTRTLSPAKPTESVTWENWMVIKAKEARQKQREEQAKAKLKQQEEQRKAEESREKLKVGQVKVKDWVEKKTLDEKLKKKTVTQKERCEQEISEMKKREVQEKANRKYEEWVQRKKEEELTQKRNLREKKKREEEEKEERRKKSQEEFEKWCKNAQNRPKSSHNSLGYTSGKLTGYYDMNANPMPTFCNPLPWIPVDVPPTKTQKPPRSKSARRWNPKKYF